MALPVHIGKVVRNALLFDFSNPRGTHLSDSSILETVERLFALLAERRIDYLLVGGIALLQYVEGRNTEDIDLIIAPSSLSRLPEIALTGQDGDFFARGLFSGLQIDLLLTTNPLFEAVARRYSTTRRFVEREIPCATVEGLIVLKLYALPSLYRQGNLVRAALYETDLLTLIHRYQPDLEPLFAELAPYLSPTDLIALRKIAAEIQGRIARFGQGF
jgi:predicted nucleotidyltransferase